MNPTESFTPGPTPNTVRASDGKVLTVPDGWVLVPPGDAALTRRIKAAGDFYAVAEKRGRKVFSRGIWTAVATVERVRAELDAERSTDTFAKRKEADARRRKQAHASYVEDFHGAVLAFLAFHEQHADLADRLARAVTDHATPVGSGTVDCALAVGFEQMAPGALTAKFTDRPTPFDDFDRETDALVGHPEIPLAIRYFGGAGIAHMQKYGSTLETFAQVRAKASRHAVNNPLALLRTNDDGGRARIARADAGRDDPVDGVPTHLRRRGGRARIGGLRAT